MIEEAKKWHIRLGHLPMSKFHSMFFEIGVKSVEDELFCIICPLAKQTRSCFTQSEIKNVHVL